MDMSCFNKHELNLSNQYLCWKVNEFFVVYPRSLQILLNLKEPKSLWVHGLRADRDLIWWSVLNLRENSLLHQSITGINESQSKRCQKSVHFVNHTNFCSKSLLSRMGLHWIAMRLKPTRNSSITIMAIHGQKVNYAIMKVDRRPFLLFERFALSFMCSSWTVLGKRTIPSCIGAGGASMPAS